MHNFEFMSQFALLGVGKGNSVELFKRVEILWPCDLEPSLLLECGFSELEFQPAFVCWLRMENYGRYSKPCMALSTLNLGNCGSIVS